MVSPGTSFGGVQVTCPSASSAMAQPKAFRSLSCPSGAILALEVVAAAEVYIGHATGEHVEGGDQDRVLDGLAGSGLAASTGRAGVLRSQVGVLAAGSGHRRDR